MNVDLYSNLIFSHDDLYFRWAELLNRFNILYIGANIGCGKTESALLFAKETYNKWAYVSAGKSDYIDELIRIINSSDGLERTLIIVDDLQYECEINRQNYLLSTLVCKNVNKNKISFILLGRMKLPEYLKPLIMANQIFEIDEKELCISKNNIEAMLDYYNLNVRNGLTGFLNKITYGNRLLVKMAFDKLLEGETGEKNLQKLIKEEAYRYYDGNLLIKMDCEKIDFLVEISGFDEFNEEMIMNVLKRKNANELIYDINSCNYFFIKNENGSYSVHSLFRQYLFEKQESLINLEKRNELYGRAGEFYEKNHDEQRALKSYYRGKQWNNLARLIEKLVENFRIIDYLKESSEYLQALPKKIIEQSPELLGCMAMVMSCEMKPEISNTYVNKLEKLLSNMDRGDSRKKRVCKLLLVLRLYLPHRGPKSFIGEIIKLSRVNFYNDVKLGNINISVNQPGMMDGVLDLCSWSQKDKPIYYLLNKFADNFLYGDVKVISDIALGESLYEKGRVTEALSYLVKGLDGASNNHNLQNEFAASEVMAKIFRAQENLKTSKQLLDNIEQEVLNYKLHQLLPNVRACKTEQALFEKNYDYVDRWFYNYAPNENRVFNITDRYQFIIKIKVYILLNKYENALKVTHLLERYARMYEREYILIKIKLLQAVILYRMKEKWQDSFTSMLLIAKKYDFVRVIADEGAAVMPLLEDYKRCSDSKYTESSFYDKLLRVTMMQTRQYPDYLIK